MSDIFATVGWAVSYPVRVAWNFDRASKIDDLDKRFQKAQAVKDTYSVRFLDLGNRVYSLRKKLQEVESSLPYDHQGAYFNRQEKVDRIQDIYEKAEEAYQRMCACADQSGPRALRELKGTWLAIGHHFEPLQGCLTEIKECRRTIEQAERELTTQERIISTTLSKAVTQSAEDFSVTREGATTVMTVAKIGLVLQGIWCLGRLCLWGWDALSAGSSLSDAESTDSAYAAACSTDGPCDSQVPPWPPRPPQPVPIHPFDAKPPPLNPTTICSGIAQQGPDLAITWPGPPFFPLPSEPAELLLDGGSSLTFPWEVVQPKAWS